MKYEGREESTNVEDQRGRGVSGMAVGGGIVGVLVVLLAGILGIDPKTLQGLGMSAGEPTPEQKQKGPVDPKQEDLRKFVSVVLKDTETVWSKQFKEKLQTSYPLPKMVLFTGAVKSGCGVAQSSVGPFYCPADEKLYLDLDFFGELTGKLGAKGKFSMAYVIAHEVGHHIQNHIAPPGERDAYIVLVNKKHNDRDGKQWQVRLELQADYLAGVWAHFADKDLKTLEPGDMDSAISAAFAVGDDTLQKKFQGRVNEAAFTHGSAKQRILWFKKGYTSGNLNGMHELFTRRYDDLDQP